MTVESEALPESFHVLMILIGNRFLWGTGISDLWRAAPLERHLDLDRLRSIAPSSTIVRNGHKDLDWLDGTLIICADSNTFASLSQDAYSLVPEEFRSSASIFLSTSPINRDLLDQRVELSYRIKQFNSNIMDTRAEMERLLLLVKASQNIARAIIGTEASKYGIGDDLLVTTRGWEEMLSRLEDSCGNEAEMLQSDIETFESKFPRFPRLENSEDRSGISQGATMFLGWPKALSPLPAQRSAF